MGRGKRYPAGLALRRARTGAGRAVSLRASTRLKNRQDEALISRSETKGFAGHGVSHWNPYNRRIRHFAELFVFNSLAPFSFRRFRGLFVFNDLARLVVSPESFPSAFDSGSHRAAA